MVVADTAHIEQRAPGGLVPTFLVLAIAYPWWKRKLFIRCGCCIFIVVHSEYDGYILDIVDLDLGWTRQAPVPVR